MITIAYMTNRKDCRFEWFCDSLHNECAGDYTGLRVVAVDFWAGDHQRQTLEGAELRKAEFLSKCRCLDFLHVPPKPTVWQGKYRLTKRDYFAAANARNTAICLAPDGYLAYVDDISVLLPGWLERVRRAQAGGYVACGTYEKVKNMEVVNGVLKSAEHTTHGLDHRLIVARKQFRRDPDLPDLVPCGGSWLFGCSLALPVQAALDVNGLCENCDSMGAEDYPFGYMLERAGYKLNLDTKMKTIESEELHFVEEPFLRIDKPSIHGQRDASNAYLKMLLSGNGMKRAPNYFGEEGIAGLRQRVLNGEPFPIVQIPQHDWRDGQLISEM